MSVRTKKREVVKDPVSYIRSHLDKSDSELAQITGETEFFCRTVREVQQRPELQRGYQANQQWREQDRKDR